jgi:hypothetical protein
MGEGTSHVDRGALVGEVPGLSSAPLCVVAVGAPRRIKPCGF